MKNRPPDVNIVVQARLPCPAPLATETGTGAGKAWLSILPSNQHLQSSLRISILVSFLPVHHLLVTTQRFWPIPDVHTRLTFLTFPLPHPRTLFNHFVGMQAVPPPRPLHSVRHLHQTRKRHLTNHILMSHPMLPIHSSAARRRVGPVWTTMPTQRHCENWTDYPQRPPEPAQASAA